MYKENEMIFVYFNQKKEVKVIEKKKCLKDINYIRLKEFINLHQ